MVGMLGKALLGWKKHCDFIHAILPGMAYRFTDISVKPIYRHFLKYRLSVSVKVRTDKISAIGYRLWPNIGFKYRLYFSDFYPIYR